MAQESEIISLLLALALLPVIWASVSRLDFAGKKWLVAAFFLVLLSFVFTVAETWILSDVLNLVEHLAVAAGMVASAVGLVQFAHEGREVARR